jgi:hypothetical protein
VNSIVCLLLKHIQTYLPEETTVRKNYLHKGYEETLNKIQVLCEKENIWVSTVETNDASGRKAADVVTGALKNHQMLSEK